MNALNALKDTIAMNELTLLRNFFHLEYCILHFKCLELTKCIFSGIIMSIY